MQTHETSLLARFHAFREHLHSASPTREPMIVASPPQSTIVDRWFLQPALLGFIVAAGAALVMALAMRTPDAVVTAALFNAVLSVPVLGMEGADQEDATADRPLAGMISRRHSKRPPHSAPQRVCLREIAHGEPTSFDLLKSSHRVVTSSLRSSSKIPRGGVPRA